jgi:hypothetical protein
MTKVFGFSTSKVDIRILGESRGLLVRIGR